jgi:peptidoglycan/LPS O-acetylase OafA/YrhL
MMGVNQRLLTLDAMRGLAAITVVFYHLEFIAPFAPSGYLAVDFFFLMSGIVIAKAYSERLNNGLGLTAFSIERITRLLPIYLIGLLVGTIRRIGQIFANHPDQLTWSQLGISFAFNLLMLPSPSTNELSPINGPAWSLFFELFANVLWACLLFKLKKQMQILYVGFLGIALLASIHITGSANHGFNWDKIQTGTLRSLFGFGLGVLMAQHFSKDHVRDSKISLIAILALFFILIFDVPLKYRAAFDVIAIFIMFPIIARLGTIFNLPRTLHSTAVILGDISYPIYVLHLAPMFTLSYAARKLNISPALWIPIFIIGIILTSLYLARTYDPTARRFFRTIAMKEKTKPIVKTRSL